MKPSEAEGDSCAFFRDHGLICGCDRFPVCRIFEREHLENFMHRTGKEKPGTFAAPPDKTGERKGKLTVTAAKQISMQEPDDKQ